MKKAVISLALPTLLMLSAASDAATAFTDAGDAVKYRQAVFQLIRHNMGDINEMLRGDVTYDVERVQKRATALASLSQLPWEAYTVPGTEKGGGDSKAAVWTNLSDFLERGDKLTADASDLKTAADTGDQAAIRRAFGAYARNCKACHDLYRN